MELLLVALFLTVPCALQTLLIHLTRARPRLRWVRWLIPLCCTGLIVAGVHTYRAPALMGLNTLAACFDFVLAGASLIGWGSGWLLAGRKQKGEKTP